MAIYALGDRVPTIHPDAFVHPEAVVIGSVFLGAGASVWPTAVLRGDTGEIRIGDRTNIQDGSIVHTTDVQFTILGDDCTVGHNVHIEASVIGNGCLISSGSVVLNGSRVDDGAVVAAGAVVSPKMHVPARRMALGVPARLREGYEVPAGGFAFAVAKYMELSKWHRTELRRIS